MRKRFLITCMPFLFLCFNNIFGQITMTNEGQLVIKDDQLIYINGHFINKSSFFSNRGDFSLTGNFWNEASVSNPGYGILRFIGNQEQTFFLYDSMSVFDMEVNNSSGLTLFGDYDLALFSEMNFNDGIVYTHSNSLLAFQTESYYFNASDFSHINGPTTKTGIDNFIFPVGKGGLLRPAGVENLTESTTFLSEYFNFQYSDLTSDNTLLRISDEEYWNLDRIGVNAQANVLLSYEDGIGGFDDINDVRMAFYNNPWTKVASIYDGSSPAFFVSQNLVSNFGQFTFADNALNQPAVTFEVYQNVDCGNELSWVIPPLTSVETFEIEVSKDSLTFVKIGAVQGDTSATTSFEVYRYIDYELYVEDILYYRVKIKQPGGASYHTETIALANKCIFLDCAVFPNPVQSSENLKLRMASEFEQELSLKIYDIPGRLLAEQLVQIQPGRNEYDIYTKFLNLPSGMYFLQLTPRKSLKFIVIYD